MRPIGGRSVDGSASGAGGARANVPRVEIAVVIPALDEADRIADVVEDACRTAGGRGSPRGASAPARATEGPDVGRGRGLPEPPGNPVEIVVVDGGSSDETVVRARGAGARVLETERGRARQLDAGWRATRGEVVVFLHADTRLGEGWVAALRRALADPRVVGGAFRLRFDRPGLAWRIVAETVRLRVWLFGLPYGDQAIFVRRRILEEMGGIPPVPLMEDLDLVAAMRARGRVAALDVVATTSARRYVEQGAVRTVARHAAALLMWRAGADRVRIARWLGR